MEDFNQIKNKVILHSDVNNFFASVECMNNPDLKNKPVAVTGNPLKRTGIILAKNEIAKKLGVSTGQTIGEAKALCPDLICLPPHYDLYEEISTQLISLYLQYTNLVEPLGLDECWLDVTGCEKYLKKTGVQIADEIRQKVKKQFNLTVSVGVSFSKIFAKLGSDLKKPDFTTEINYESFKALTYDLPLNSIVGIGKRLNKKFQSIGIKKILDFVNLDDTFIQHVMGIVGINLKKDLLAQRFVPVLDYYKLPPPKSIGNGTTAIYDIMKREDLKKILYFLCQKISARLINHKVYANNISLTIKNKNLKTFHKSIKINPTNEINALVSFAIDIADKIWDYRQPIRAIRIKTSSFTSSNFKQLSIFDENKNDYSEILNLINKKYGNIEIASNNQKFINKSSHPQE